jgi:hypothetical protein
VADRPASGEELVLMPSPARQNPNLVFVSRDVDRQSDEERPVGTAFTEGAALTGLVNGFHGRGAAVSGLEGRSPRNVDAGFKSASRLSDARGLAVAPWSARRSVLDLLRSRRRRLRATQGTVSGYRAPLLDANRPRVKNDFLGCGLEDQPLEAELGDRRAELTSPAEPALDRERHTQSAAAADIRLTSIAACCWQVEQLHRGGEA